MIKSFTVTNFLGDSIKLTLTEPERTGFLVLNVEGLGPAKSLINTTPIATQDGARFNSARSDSRNIVFTILFYNSINHESIEELRHKTYKYFPLKKNVTIEVETETRTIKTVGYVESNEPTIFSAEEGTNISVVCPDPYFYNSGNDIITNFYSVESLFEFPFSNESLTEPLLTFGNINNTTEGVITYQGDTDVGIKIFIHAIGPATNLSVYNMNTRENMRIDTTKLEKLTGHGIIAHDDIIITTIKGNKEVVLIRDGVSHNILNCLDKNASWFTLTRGDNIFAFSADDGITNLQFRIENKVVYVGV